LIIYWELMKILYYADDARSLEDKYPVSFFPSGIDGLDAQSIRYIDLKGNKAYKAYGLIK
jgi:hypothetical protein